MLSTGHSSQGASCKDSRSLQLFLKLTIESILIFKITFIYFCWRQAASTRHSPCVEVRGQLVGFSSLLQGLHSGCQAWWQVPLPTEPSYQLCLSFNTRKIWVIVSLKDFTLGKNTKAVVSLICHLFHAMHIKWTPSSSSAYGPDLCRWWASPVSWLFCQADTISRLVYLVKGKGKRIKEQVVYMVTTRGHPQLSHEYLCAPHTQPRAWIGRGVWGDSHLSSVDPQVIDFEGLSRPHPCSVESSRSKCGLESSSISVQPPIA